MNKYVKDFAKMKNVEYLTLHAEGHRRPIDVINMIRHTDMKVGLAINPETKVSRIIPLLNHVDQVLVMSVKPGKGGQLIRSAGNSAQILGREERYVLVRLASGEVRKILSTCRATVGEVGNESWELVNVGKAGRSRHMGKRPEVRGSVMNPNDHPHGGGEGRCPIGRPTPVTPWGKPALGLKTRKHKKASNKLIVRRRNAK